jgi:cytochrome c oxidase subunit 2
MNSRKLVLMSLLLAFSIGHVIWNRAAHAQSGARQIEVTAKRFVYAPGEITLKKGEPVILLIKSADVAHGLRFRELNLDTKIDKGGIARLSFTPDKTGDFVGHCSVFCGSGHGEMTLTLHVVE